MSQLAISVPSKRLQAPLTTADMTFRVNNILSWLGLQDGTTELTAADFGDYGWVTFRDTASRKIEFCKFDPTTITSSSITLLTRGLSYSGGTTSIPANILDWEASDTIVEFGSHPPQLFEMYVDKYSAETISNVKTFTSNPRKGSTTLASNTDDYITMADLLNATLGSVITSKLIISITAGETFSAGTPVYFKESDQRWWKTDADAFATASNVKIAIAQSAGTAGASANILLAGLDENQTGLTAGAKYYLSGTAGAITTTPGAKSRFVGWAISTTSLLFAPDELAENLSFSTGGETITTGDTVYFKTSDQRWWKTDADAIATSVNVLIGIAQTDSTAGNPIIVRTNGIDRTVTGLTPGSSYYLSATAGALSTTANARYVGLALSANELLFNGNYNPDTHFPTGCVQMHAGSSAPTGWLLCDGSAVSRTTYAGLFAILSTTYGAGDASTTFNVPDMRGRVPVGVGTGTGGGSSGTGAPTGGSALTAVARGTWKGAETHTLTEAEMPAHTHTSGVFTTGGIGTPAAATGANATPTTTSSTGGGGAHNNVQPVMGLNFIIKY